MMRGASLRSVLELLGHQSMKMTHGLRHLSPAFLSAEVSLSIRHRPLLRRPQGKDRNGKTRATCAGTWLLGLDSSTLARGAAAGGVS
jgi:hypothetical protein